MTQPVLTSDTRMCDRPGCDKVATQSYLWDWGEKGVCCDHHAVLLQQTAGQLSRNVTLSALREVVVELTRDERTQFRAQILTLEEEVEVTKGRGLELYRINQQMQGEKRLAELRAEEARVQLVESEKRVETLTQKLSDRDAENANLLQQVEQLQLRLDVGDYTDHGLGEHQTQEHQHTVDG